MQAVKRSQYRSDVGTEVVDMGLGVKIGGGGPLTVVAGPCVIESADHALFLAERVALVARRVACGFVFKASYDKANRSSVNGFRGPGLDEGLRILERVRREVGVPVLSDVHEVAHVASAAGVLDCLQIPAFLCRQTDLLFAAGASGKAVNIKKGQFLAPADMGQAIEKVAAGGGSRILVTERGTTFGYHNLVVDFRGLAIMKDLGRPVIFDATHSVQLPGAQGSSSGGEPQFIAPLARAAAAVGVDGLFVEVHENPAVAKSDGANALALDRLEPLLLRLVAIHALVRQA